MSNPANELAEHYKILASLNYEKMDNSEIQTEVNKLFSLRTRLNGSPKLLVKTAKGTQDFTPCQMIIREGILSQIVGCFKRHGAETIDTPVFERKEILTGKYGEDSKLIYDLVDQGGELLSLRYDLTVPFARYLASKKMSNMKRYHIGKVYRRDNPAMTRGRFREFVQCDFDIAGDYSPMLADAEVLRIVHEIFTGLDLGDFTIKVNSRKLLDGMLASLHSPPDKFATICSSIDKLDKVSWEEVAEELAAVKGVDSSVVAGLEKYVKLSGGRELIGALMADRQLCSVASSLEALGDMDLLFEYCDSFGVAGKLNFDLSLARGLDYYTGLIFEVQLLEAGLAVGSVAGGGRYDNLVNMFQESKARIPCVGFSLGIERLFAIVENAMRERNAVPKTSWTDVFVITIPHRMDPDLVRRMTHERIRICRELFEGGFNTEFCYKANSSFKAQKMMCQEKQIKFAVIVGQDEVEAGQVIIQNVDSREEVKVPREQMLPELGRLLEM